METTTPIIEVKPSELAILRHAIDILKDIEDKGLAYLREPQEDAGRAGRATYIAGHADVAASAVFHTLNTLNAYGDFTVPPAVLFGKDHEEETGTE